MFISPFYMKLDNKIKYTTALQKGNQVGLSLGLSTFLFTSIKKPEILLLDFLLGTFTYGIDREIDDNNMLLYNGIFGLCCLLLLKNNLTKLYIPILYLTKYYKNNKNKLKIFKPWIITLLWCSTVIILPHLYISGSFNLDTNFNSLCSFSFLLYSLSNSNDLKDEQDDIENNITTFANYFNKTLVKDIIILNLICSIVFGLKIYLQ